MSSSHRAQESRRRARRDSDLTMVGSTDVGAISVSTARPHPSASVMSHERRLLRSHKKPLTTYSMEEFEAADAIARLRPPALREFDQIPMRTGDLLRQVKTVAPMLAGRNVAFIG